MQLRSARELRHVSPATLADRVGISLEALENIERGTDGCSVDLLGKLATAVGMRLDVRFRPVDAWPDSVICHQCFTALPLSSSPLQEPNHR